MKKTPKKGDVNQRALAVVHEAIAVEDETTPTDPRILNGASKGGKSRAAKLSARERSEIAKKAANSRWHAKG